MDFPSWAREKAAEVRHTLEETLEPYTTPPIEVIANATPPNEVIVDATVLDLPEDPPEIAERRRFIAEHMGHALRRLQYAAIVGGSAIALNAAADINFGALAGPLTAYMGVAAHMHYRNATVMSSRLASNPNAITWSVQPPTPQDLG